MKQKTGFILMIIVWLIVSALLGTSFVYAADEEDKTTMVFEKVDGKEAVRLGMDIAQNQGATSFQTSFKITNTNLADIQNVKIDWDQSMEKNAQFKTASYDKDTGVFHIYVVGKTELTVVDNKGNITLNIGTITFDTKNTSEMKIEMVAGNTVFGDMVHSTREIAANEATEKMDMTIAAKATPEDPNNPNNPNDPSNPNNPNNPNNPSNPNDPSNPSNPGEEGGDNQNPGSNNNGNGQNGGKDSQSNNKYGGNLPFAGLIKDHKITILIILAALVIVTLVVAIVIKNRSKDLPKQ